MAIRCDGSGLKLVIPSSFRAVRIYMPFAIFNINYLLYEITKYDS